MAAVAAPQPGQGMAAGDRGRLPLPHTMDPIENESGQQGRFALPRAGAEAKEGKRITRPRRWRNTRIRPGWPLLAEFRRMDHQLNRR